MNNLTMSRKEFDMQYATGAITNGEIKFLKRYPNGGCLIGDPVIYGCVIISGILICHVCVKYIQSDEVQQYMRSNSWSLIPWPSTKLKCLSGGLASDFNCYTPGEEQTIFFEDTL